MAEADRAGEAELIFHALHETGQQDRRRFAVQSLRSGQVHERFIQRQRLDRWRQVFHHRANLAADFDVDGHSSSQHHGVRAQFQRLEHWHR